MRQPRNTIGRTGKIAVDISLAEAPYDMIELKKNGFHCHV